MSRNFNFKLRHYQLHQRPVSPASLRLVRRPPMPPVFDVGDSVQLNSGGPVCMVVDTIDADKVVVAWRDGDGTVHEADLPRPCLAEILISN